jgi:hypothetical protein
MYRKESIMPMPQYNGPTYGYNPYQTYLPQSPWQGPQPYTQPQTAQLPVQQVQTQANQNAYLVAQLKTPAPVPAYTVPNPNGYYGCQQNCYQSCGC